MVLLQALTFLVAASEKIEQDIRQIMHEKQVSY